MVVSSNKDSPTVLPCLYLIKRAWNRPNSSNSCGKHRECYYRRPDNQDICLESGSACSLASLVTRSDCNQASRRAGAGGQADVTMVTEFPSLCSNAALLTDYNGRCPPVLLPYSSSEHQSSDIMSAGEGSVSLWVGVKRLLTCDGPILSTYIQAEEAGVYETLISSYSNTTAMWPARSPEILNQELVRTDMDF
ncbi:hypothetical protein Bbelb_119710 [Branchiostoma belcheri]|nr:hypothetical protein Bbelb_439730 [Branchiostoma belcheri]KAI8511055.1 hypothetical protein Bbelb_119710 [Branchiostoma belcheri]